MRTGFGYRLIAVALVFAIAPVLAVDDKTQPKGASRPPMAEPKQGPVAVMVEVIKIPCPRSNLDMRVTLGTSDATNWTPQIAYLSGLHAKSCERSKGDARDELLCFYTVSALGHGTSFKYYVKRSALATHPVCRAGEDVFECRRLKQGENYATASY